MSVKVTTRCTKSGVQDIVCGHTPYDGDDYLSYEYGYIVHPKEIEDCQAEIAELKTLTLSQGATLGDLKLDNVQLRKECVHFKALAKESVDEWVLHICFYLNLIGEPTMGNIKSQEKRSKEIQEQTK